MSDQENSGQGSQGFIVTDEHLGEFKNHPVFEAFKGQPISKMFKSIENAHKLTEGQIVAPKGKNDRPEVWDQVWNKLGRPRDPSGYVFNKPDLPGGLRYDAALERAFAAKCHEIGILPKQAQALFDFYSDQARTALETAMRAKEVEFGEAHAQIHEIFGNETDLALKVANQMLHTFGGSPEEIQYIADNYGNDPKLIALLARVGMQTREDSVVRGEKSERFDNRVSAASEKKKVYHDKDHPLHEAYFQKSHPRHQEAVDYVTRLNTILTGEDEE